MLKCSMLIYTTMRPNGHINRRLETVYVDRRLSHDLPPGKWTCTIVNAPTPSMVGKRFAAAFRDAPTVAGSVPSTVADVDGAGLTDAEFQAVWDTASPFRVAIDPMEPR